MSFISDIFGGGGGGGGQQNTGSTQTSSTSYNTNIPEYAQPYVTSMLNATQRQLFNVDSSGNITGFSPYRAYGGTYDAQGNQLSYDPSKGIAGFSPLQQQVQKDVAALKTPGQYGMASDMTGRAAMDTQWNAMNEAMAGQNYARQATDPGSVAAYMNPYLQQSLAPQLQLLAQQTGIQGANQQAAATSSGAFGGSRSALANALVQQQGNLAAQQAIAQGYNQAFGQAQQAQQFGANLGLQGQQAAQAGYGQMGTLANQLAGIGTQDLAAKQAILNQQNTVGGQQQAYQQSILNQSMQDYANAQQYPLMQLGTMSNMLRGLPMQSSTTQQYIAQPNATTQAIGTAGSLASLYNATKAKGGIIDAKKYAAGGEVADSVESKLYDMSLPELQKELQSPSGEIRKMAKRIMLEKKIEGMAGGGIVAFAEGGQPELEAIPEPETATDVRYAAPTAENPRGIVAAARPAPAPAPAQRIDTSPEGVKRALAQQIQYNQSQANRSLADIAAERAAYLGPNTGDAEYRKQIMSERANAKDEAVRQNWMRAAEFFADWGSRPGNTLSAGMLALKQVIPNVISDTQKQKEYERDIQKTLHSLDKAARAEKAGDFDKAEQIRKDAGEAAFRNLGTLSTLVGHEEQAAASLKAAQIHASVAGRPDALDKTTAIIKADLLARGFPNNAATDAMARTQAIEATGMAGEKLSLDRAAKIEKAFKDSDELKSLNREKMMAEPKDIPAIDEKIAAEKRRIQASFPAAQSAAAAPAPAPAAAPAAPAAKASEDSVTVGGKTYARPATFTDAQWRDYKKSVGAS